MTYLLALLLLGVAFVIARRAKLFGDDASAPSRPAPSRTASPITQQPATQRPITQQPATQQPGAKRLPSPAGIVSANFFATGSGAWAGQPGGVEPLSGKRYPAGSHTGTDYSGPPGTLVYAPFAMSVVRIGEYTDPGKAGLYVIGTLSDGNELYLGHLGSIYPSVRVGAQLQSGDTIGTMNRLAHTHVQLRVGGQLADFERYYANR